MNEVDLEAEVLKQLLSGDLDLRLPDPEILTIVSGGQTGVDRAALDAAIQVGLPYMGWCPKEGWAEDLQKSPGLLNRYPLLQETPSKSTAQRTVWNVRDSHFTLIIDDTVSSKGTQLAEIAAKKLKPSSTIAKVNIHEGSIFNLAEQIKSSKATTLNIAGPRASESEDIYLKSFFYFLNLFEFLKSN